MHDTTLRVVRPITDWQVPTELPDLRRVGIISIDTETHDKRLQADMGSGWPFRSGHIAGVSVAHRAEGGLQGVYLPIRHPDTQNFDPEQIYQWVRDHVAADVRFVTQNGLYDWGWLRSEAGIRMPPSERLEEIGALATLIDENRYRYSLDALCAWRNLPGKDEVLLREGIEALELVTNKRKKVVPQNHIWQLPARYVGPYAGADAVSTLALFEDLNPILDREGTRGAYRLEVDLLPMVLEMRLRGIRVDLDAAERRRDLLLQKRDAVFAELSEKLECPVGMAEIGRSKWLAETFDRLGIKYPRTEKGNPSFTGGQAGWMSRHAHWLPQGITKADKYNNAATKFLQGYIIDHSVNGRIHAEIHPHRSEDNGAKSFRFSYSDPPLQQMTSRDDELAPLIRGCFLPEEGEVWAKPDASQQEFRFVVHYANLHKLRKAAEAVARYRDNPDADFHALAATLTGLDRPSAKSVNFAKIYGAGVRKFAQMINKPLDEAQRIYAQYDRELPFLRLLSEIYTKQARSQGYITLYDGARRHFNKFAPGGKWEKGAGPCSFEEARERLKDPNHPWYHGGTLYRADTHTALNALIQGSAARHTKLWMRAVWREGITPLLQMHDCLDCSVSSREQAELVARLGCEAVQLDVPMQVDLKFGRNWGDAKHTWAELHGTVDSECAKPAVSTSTKAAPTTPEAATNADAPAKLLQPDREELAKFIEIVFRHATPGTWVSPRAFYNDKSIIEWARTTPDLAKLIDKAFDTARRAANTKDAYVFSPPIATFSNNNHAREEDLAEGLAISVECDERAQAARERLEEILGPATCVVESGGRWLNPENQEEAPKLHVHWVLKVPARTPEELARLKQARRLATEIVGADPSNITIVHPIRWPGSWHRKKEPRLCRIVGGEHEREIDLETAFEALQAAAPEKVDATAPQDHKPNGGDRTMGIASIETALAIIPNNRVDDWNYWNHIGMATWVASSGSAQGLAAFDRWSQLWPVHSEERHYSEKLTNERWAAYSTTPIHTLGAQTLVWEADQVLPGWRDLYPNDPILKPYLDQFYDGVTVAPGNKEETAEAPNAEAPNAEAPNAEAPGAGERRTLFDPWAKFIVPAFPIETLPPVLRDFVISQSEVIGVDHGSMAMIVLGSVSSAINHRFRVKMMLHGNWFARPRLWVLLYGDASFKKTPVFDNATLPLEDYQSELQQGYRDELNCYELQRDMEKAGELQGAPGKKPQPPVRYVVYDTTIEKLGELLARGGGRGLLVKRDEFSGWIGSMEKYTSGRGGSANRAFWLKAYDGGGYTVDRQTRGELFIDILSVSLIGSVQPERLQELQGLTSDGLLQRFLPVIMTESRLPKDRAVNTSDYATLIRNLIELPPCDLAFAADAQQVVRDTLQYLHQLNKAVGGVARGFQSFVAKLDGIVGSLALLLHLATDPRTGSECEISKTTVLNVAQLIREFLIPHAMEFYRGAEGVNQDPLRKLASYIVTNNKERVIASDLTANIWSFRGLSLVEVNERVSPLIAGGWLQPTEKGNWCRSWTVQPTVFAHFAERAREEEAQKRILTELMNSPRKGKPQ